MIVVLTCGDRPYLEPTLKQIEASAVGRKVILVDGQSTEISRPGWEIICSPRPLVAPQNKWTAWKAFELAAEAKEDLCFFEDDLEFAKNAPRYIEDFPVPGDLGFVTFFSPWMTKELPTGLWRIHAHSYVMAQALKFPLRSALELVAARHEDVWQTGRFLGGFDEILHHVAISRRWRYGIVNPGFVQHVGEVSLVGNGGLKGMRVAKNYTGTETDALAFRPMHELGFFS